MSERLSMPPSAADVPRSGESGLLAPSSAAVAVRRVTVEGRAVRLDVRVLDAAERRSLAAAIAWLAHEEAECGRTAWEAFANLTIGRHVAFTIAPPDLAAVDGAWWRCAVEAALAALTEVNDLTPAIRAASAALPAMAGGATGSGRLAS